MAEGKSSECRFMLFVEWLSHVFSMFSFLMSLYNQKVVVLIVCFQGPQESATSSGKFNTFYTHQV